MRVEGINKRRLLLNFLKPKKIDGKLGSGSHAREKEFGEAVIKELR
jgi:hypothetical protein